MKSLVSVNTPVVFGLLLLSPSAPSTEHKIILVLDESFCKSYPKEITEALTAIEGVTRVALTEARGHAIVSHDGRVSPETLVAVVKSINAARAEAGATVMK
jgi:copper chaperone CopZ